MKANELRIGNYVNYADENHLFKVIGIDDLGIRVKDDEQETWIEYDCFEPIPLTEEWLLKFGFEDREFSFDKDKFFLTKRSGRKEYLYQAHQNRFQIKSVHHLQNLYFALRNEELNIKK